MKVIVRHELNVDQINGLPAHRLDVYDECGVLLIRGEADLLTRSICVWYSNMRYIGVFLTKEGFVVIAGKVMSALHDGPSGTNYVEVTSNK